MYYFMCVHFIEGLFFSVKYFRCHKNIIFDERSFQCLWSMTCKLMAIGTEIMAAPAASISSSRLLDAMTS